MMAFEGMRLLFNVTGVKGYPARAFLDGGNITDGCVVDIGGCLCAIG